MGSGNRRGIFIEQLRDFLAVVKYGSFSIAADEQFLSASSLSKHISALEAELGVKLFERTTRSVAVTPSGRLLIPHAEAIVQEEELLRNEILRSQYESKKELRIASLPVLAHFGITDILSAFRLAYPDVTLSITELEILNIGSFLSRGLFDAAFLGHVPEGMKAINIITDRIVAVMPRTHPLAQSVAIHLGDLRHEKLLLLDENTGLYQEQVDACLSAGFTPNVVFKGHHPENILKFVSREMGVGLMMRPLVDFYDFPEICSVPIIEPVIEANVYLAWAGKTPQKPALTKLLGYVESLIASPPAGPDQGNQYLF